MIFCHICIEKSLLSDALEAGAYFRAEGSAFLTWFDDTGLNECSLGSIHFLEGRVGWRNRYEHECKISRPSLYIWC